MQQNKAKGVLEWQWRCWL